MLQRIDGQISLSSEQKEMLRELLTHEGWRLYQELLLDLRDDILANFKSKSIRSTEDLVEVAKDQARLELLENVVIPLIKDFLEEEM